MSHGYYYYSFVRLPEKKRSRWPAIDKKLMERFDVGISRNIRYQRKKAGKPNYVYLRYDDMVVILKTDGEDSPERLQQGFKDLREYPLEIRIGKEMELKLHSKVENTGFTVCLSKTCYRDLKTKLLELLDTRQLDKVKYYFNALNGIPAYAGIIENKKFLLSFILSSAKKRGLSQEG